MVRDAPGDQAPQRVGQPRDLLGNDVQTKGFDRDQAIALRIVCAKNWS
jgi:hypothetical protein